MGSEGLLDPHALGQLLKKQRKHRKPFVDLSLVDEQGNTALHLYFKSAVSSYQHQHPGVELMKELIDKPNLLQRIDLLSANDADETIIALAAQHAVAPIQHSANPMANKEKNLAACEKFMRVWQKERKQVIRSVTTHRATRERRIQPLER